LPVGIGQQVAPDDLVGHPLADHLAGADVGVEQVGPLLHRQSNAQRERIR
jgi:hypothetical protein